MMKIILKKTKVTANQILIMVSKSILTKPKKQKIKNNKFEKHQKAFLFIFAFCFCVINSFAQTKEDENTKKMFIWAPEPSNFIQTNNLKNTNVSIEIKDLRVIAPKSNVNTTFSQISNAITQDITDRLGKEFINKNSEIKVIIEVHNYDATFYTGMWKGQTKYVVFLNNIRENIEQNNFLFNTNGYSTAKEVLNKSFAGANMQLFNFFNNHLGAKSNTDVYVIFCGIEILVADLPDKYDWEKAQRFCPQGWRVPTSEELKCICENKMRIGGINESQYWTKDEKNNKAISRTTNDCKVEIEKKDKKYNVRCVR